MVPLLASQEGDPCCRHADVGLLPLVDGGDECCKVGRGKEAESVTQLPRTVWRALGAVAFMAIAFGYELAMLGSLITAGQLLCEEDAETRLKTSSWTNLGYQQCYVITDFEQGLLTSAPFWVAFLADLAIAGYGDARCRRDAVLFACACYVCGCCLLCLSANLATVATGLVVMGCGNGFFIFGGPLYLGEISPPSFRGMIVSLKELFVVSGMLLAFAVSTLVLPQVPHHGWRVIALSPGLCAILAAVGLVSLPYSPRWLLLRLRTRGTLSAEDDLAGMHQAREALRFFRGSSSEDGEKAVSEELRGILLSVQSQEERGWRAALRTPGPLLIGTAISFTASFSGQVTVLCYMKRIFDDAGLGNIDVWAALLVGATKFVAVLFVIPHFEKHGRRQFFLIGLSVMIFGLLVAGTVELDAVCSGGLPECGAAELTLPRRHGFVLLAALMLLVIGYEISFGPLVFVISSEIFPLSQRSFCKAVSGACCDFAMSLTALLYPWMENALRPAGAYYSFAVCASAGFAFIYRRLPETKGKTLEEIEVLFGRS
eukprot:TRINITY_DN30733_c1_g1_i1.p1 TRINITY_DN30733_c1_g1~~TRINITY_DN30733_c1_g1_i1.p1  ORF type:complete len:543 (+),score=94.55 TRINITY_DN30733_c1_g1_i1:51-1679(+)